MTVALIVLALAVWVLLFVVALARSAARGDRAWDRAVEERRQERWRAHHKAWLTDMDHHARMGREHHARMERELRDLISKREDAA